MADEKKEKNSTKESVARWFTYSGIAVLVIAIFGSGIYYFQSNGSGLVGSATQGVQSWQNYDIPEMGSMVTIDLNGFRSGSMNDVLPIIQ